MNWRSVLAATAITVGGTATTLHADTLESAAVEALERFYHQFDGDNWHRNDGWLDPAVDPCDWFGVECGSWAGQFGIRTLDLAVNNLHGELSTSDIFEHVITRIDLSDNAITGTLPVFPYWLRHIHLADNRLTGPLPEAPANHGDTILNLDLARNQIEDKLPESWGQLGIAYLDLSGNRLSGDFSIALRAADNYINIADNRYTGSLDHAIVGHLLKHNSTATAGGINLCWNDFSVSSSFMMEFVGERHVGGMNFLDCLARERLPLDQSISGSWFDLDRAGEGISMHLLDGGGVLKYSFSFDGDGRQHWLIGIGREFDTTLHWLDSIESTRGRFLHGQADPMRGGPGFGLNWRMDRVGMDHFHLERTYHDFSHCESSSHGSMPCPSQPHSDRLEYMRLTAPAGTRCDNQNPLQGLSGAWYDPDRSGEGFVVEVLADGRGVVYWFTYQPDDSMHQAWMMGDGEFDGQTLFIDNLVQPSGGRWGDDFDPADIVMNPWGSLTMEFFDELNGHIHFDSLNETYGSGDHPIERLSRVRVAECAD